MSVLEFIGLAAVIWGAFVLLMIILYWKSSR